MAGGCGQHISSTSSHRRGTYSRAGQAALPYLDQLLYWLRPVLREGRPVPLADAQCVDLQLLKSPVHGDRRQLRFRVRVQGLGVQLGCRGRARVGECGGRGGAASHSGEWLQGDRGVAAGDWGRRACLHPAAVPHRG